MKKTLFIAAIISILNFQFSILHLSAQGGVPQPRRYAVNFESHNGESFNVFIDGTIVNRMPQSRVLVNDVTDRTHQVVVVMKRPTQKAAVLNLLPGEPNIMVTVNYDQRSDELTLYTPACNRAEDRPEVAEVPRIKNITPPKTKPSHKKADTPPPPRHAEPDEERDVQVPQRVSDEDLAAMLLRMKKQTFDSDRLALGRVIVASSNLTARQIAALVETLDYSSSQVDLLKYAYPYCIDPRNYSQAVDVLTFSSDKKKVLDYISTQN